MEQQFRAEKTLLSNRINNEFLIINLATVRAERNSISFVSASFRLCYYLKGAIYLPMSRKYKFYDNDKLFFISFATINWIDVFVREDYNQIIIDSWKHCQERKGLEIYGWCIMPSHVHMIIGSTEKALDKIVGEMKSYTSTQLRKCIKDHPQESRREWMMWMFERAGKKNGNNNEWSRMLSEATA